MDVFVKCKNCHRDFYTGLIAEGIEALKTYTLHNNDMECPFCMEWRTYDSTDYFLQK